MKTLFKERRERPGTVPLATMKFVKGPAVILIFDDGKKAKLGTGFVADAIEHYCEFCINKALEYENATKKRKK